MKILSVSPVSVSVISYTVKKHPVIHGSCSDHVISVVLQLMICGCMDLTSMSTAQMCLPFVIDEVHCSLPQIGRMLFFREK